MLKSISLDTSTANPQQFTHLTPAKTINMEIEIKEQEVFQDQLHVSLHGQLNY